VIGLRFGLPALVFAHALGILAADFGWPAVSGRACQGLALACAILVGVLRGYPAARKGAALLLAFVAGAGSLAARLDSSARFAPRETRELSLEARVCGLERNGARGFVELCSAMEVPSPGDEAVWREPPRLPARLLGQFRPMAPEVAVLDGLMRGDRLRARVRVGPLGGLRNPGRSDPARRWRRRGIGGRVFFVDPALVVVLRNAPDPGGSALLSRPLSGSLSAHLGAGLDGLRKQIFQGLVSGADEPGLRGTGSAESGGLLAALAVGDREGLRPATRDAFARLGIAHVLAVSGLHLALAAGLVFSLAHFVLGWLGDRGRDLRLGALAAAAVGAAAYALLAGFGTPVQRALAFVCANLWALTLGRRIPLAHLFSIAGLWVGLAAPQVLFELGAQLSFSATAALLSAHRNPAQDAPPDASILRRTAGRFRFLLHLSALALVATAPWLAWRGLSPGGAGLLLNLVAIPWITWVLLPASLLAASVVGLDANFASWILAAAHAVAGLTLNAVHGLSNTLPSFPPAYGRPQWPALIVAAGLAVVACRQLETRKAVIIALTGVLWLRGAPIANLASPPPRFVMFDVGQGDALLVEGERSAILVDAGRAIPGSFDLGRSVVVPALAALGVESLDAVVATHGDIDHRGGIPAVLGAIPVAEVWLPWGGRNDPAFGSVLEVARLRGVKVIEMGAESPPRQIGDLRVTPLWPRHGREGDSANARSLVLALELAGWRMLLTGDIGIGVETELRLSGVNLAADLLKVAHHGSAGSSSAEFLGAIGPRWLMLSAPCGGGSRLPHPRALKRLVRSGGRLAWTGRDGAVVLGLDSGHGESVLFSAPGWGGPRPCGGAISSPRSAWRQPPLNP
jgi:competence protein ComEC